MKYVKVLCLAVIISSAVFLPASAQYGIVTTTNDELSRYAAKELRKYAGMLTREKCSITNTLPRETSIKCIVLGAVSGRSKGNELIERQAAALKGKGDDAFIITSDKTNGRQSLYIVGNTPQALLYGVYHYLEFVCGIGFFVDGEYVPKIDRLPFENIKIVQQPRFDIRFWNSDFGHHSLWKYQSAFWGKRQWERQISWMNKRKLNFTNLVNLYKFRDLRLVRIYHPLQKKLTRLQKYVSESNKWALRQCRKFGIKNIYWVNFGDVDKEFVEQHPEIKFSEPDMYGQIYIDPDDPAGERYTKKFLRTLIENYGTDNYYGFSPYCEYSPGTSDDEAIYLKTQAALKFYEVLKEVDPKATWVLDTWDFTNRKLWTPERVKQFLKSFKDLDILIYDTHAEYPGRDNHNIYNGFSGVKWAFGVLVSFARDDENHGNIALTLEKIKKAADRYKNDIGLFMVPELTNSNVFFWHLMSLAAWSPEGWSIDTYIPWFCRRRYGKESAKMELVWKEVVQAVYQEERYMHRALYKHQDATLGFPALQEQLTTYLNRAKALRKAVKMALEQRQLYTNPLYENDIVTLARNYLGYCYNYNFVAANRAFTTGDTAAFERYQNICLKILKDLELLLSTREDYSVKAMINEIQRLSGSDEVPRVVREGCIVLGDYPANDVYEMFSLYYIPRAQKYFQALDRRLKAGSKEFPKEEIEKIIQDARNNWLENEIDLKRCARFEGTTLQAVQKVMSNIEMIFWSKQ